jgi:hypothetical protein
MRKDKINIENENIVDAGPSFCQYHIVYQIICKTFWVVRDMGCSGYAKRR